MDAVLTADRPPIEWPSPIDPSQTSIDDARDRIDELLAPLPDLITAADVPNGVVRQSIASNRGDAVDGRKSGAATRYRHLCHSPAAREAARHARTTFDAIDRDHESLVADIRTERADTSETVRTQLDAIDYHGPDTSSGKLRAALVARQREDDLVRADRILDDWDGSASDNVIDLGEAAGEIERASATASVWSHLADRYEASQSGAVSLDSSFSTAIDRSLDRIATVDFPPQEDEGWYAAVGVDDLDDGGVLELALWRVGRGVIDAADGVESASEAGRLGTALYHALVFEVRYRAFQTFRDRIRDGSFAWPASVSTIEAERSAAFEAAETVRQSISGPTPGTLVLAETLQSLEWADERVRNAADNDPDVHVSLDDEYRLYARCRAELAALPDAVAAFRDRLGGD
ncbi:hypothetical protein C479_01886 [Halovivax asiaticus JCM 14624]|uniref:Uncharacterized protein n=1 Tax=Halovivax asiaticus JCM 14624 TaxID=1227490 RepID=M0BRD9_9EURY|nr:hypothetical protein C479_01886 [Halovivax asiaticus JCM 14624]